GGSVAQRQAAGPWQTRAIIFKAKKQECRSWGGLGFVGFAACQVRGRSRFSDFARTARGAEEGGRVALPSFSFIGPLVSGCFVWSFPKRSHSRHAPSVLPIPGLFWPGFASGCSSAEV
ncbi:unnamed protein product, partial [Amoebophrya sp. A120]